MSAQAVALLAAWFLAHNLAEAQETNCARRLFDFTPISKTNPVVARIGDSIAIPLSEYQAFRQAEKQNVAAVIPIQKRAILDDLIAEYLLVDEAYRTGADRHPEFIRRMNYTRTILLTEFLVAREVDDKAKTAEEYTRLLEGLQNRLFDAAEIVVSNEAYDKLKRAANALNAGGEATPAKFRELAEPMNNTVLGRYNGTAIAAKEILAIYAGLTPPRPRLEANSNLVELLKPLIVPSLMADEARKQNIETLPAFRNKVDQNRNALLRIHMHGLLQARASEGMKVPDLDERLQSWYRQNASRYTVETATGVKTDPPYSEVRDRVEGDYSVDLWERLQAEKVRALRKAARIEIDENALSQCE